MRPTAEQERGGEFSGITRQNTLQAKEKVTDLTAAELRRLIVTTGQDADPAAIARSRNFMGQMGPKPTDPPPPRYMR